MKSIDRISGAVLFFAALLVVWEGRVLPLGSLHNPGPGYMPVLLAFVLGGLSILIVLPGRNSPPLESLRWGEGKHSLAILGACAFAAVALERIGFRITMILLLVFLLGVVERLKPLTVLSVSVGLSLGSFWFFHNLLKVPLPLSALGF